VVCASLQAGQFCLYVFFSVSVMLRVSVTVP
jgi:hypothetical protein